MLFMSANNGVNSQVFFEGSTKKVAIIIFCREPIFSGWKEVLGTTGRGWNGFWKSVLHHLSNDGCAMACKTCFIYGLQCTSSSAMHRIYGLVFVFTFYLLLLFIQNHSYCVVCFTGCFEVDKNTVGARSFSWRCVECPRFTCIRLT